MSALPLGSEVSLMEGIADLKSSIMQDIEQKLSQKEEQLWKRGQVELKRVQHDHQQMKDCMSQMQERQSALFIENQALKDALVEVTSRFEVVVKEIREVMRALPQHCNDGVVDIKCADTTGHEPALHPSPSPSAASTSASDGLQEDPTSENGSEATTDASRRSSERRECDSQNFLTPTRTSMTPQLPNLDSDSRESWPRMSSSLPVLSLANSLPPAATSSSALKSPPEGCKRLQLAECLNAGQVTPQPAAPPASPSSTKVSEASGSAIATGATTPSSHHSDLFNVEIVKEPGFHTLGIEVNQVDGVSLRVESIDEHGLVGRHNSRQESTPTNRVRTGDRIIEVNGLGQDPNMMLQECKNCQKLVFTIARDSRQVSIVQKAAAAGNDATVEDEAGEAEQNPKQAVWPPSAAEFRLRPEANVFVPAGQSAPEVQAPPCMLPAVAVVPPGLSAFDTSGMVPMQTDPTAGLQYGMLEAAISNFMASTARDASYQAQQPFPPMIGAGMGYSTA